MGELIWGGPLFAVLRMLARCIYRWFASLFFDPLRLARQWRALPYFLRNSIKWRRLCKGERFRFFWRESLFCSADRFASAGTAHGHYFWQDLWAAETLYGEGVRAHIDVGSRLDGFIAHLLPFCHVTYVDIRPLDIVHPHFEFRRGSILSLPFPDGSLLSLSCLHVIEHIGLGRYGDPIDPDGYRKAAGELIRVLAPSGHLLIGTPVGRERLCFDAHRVFDPETITKAFLPLCLESFHLIDDRGEQIQFDAAFDLARGCEYGCGLFRFRHQ